MGQIRIRKAELLQSKPGLPCKNWSIPTTLQIYLFKSYTPDLGTQNCWDSVPNPPQDHSKTCRLSQICDSCEALYLSWSCNSCATAFAVDFFGKSCFYNINSLCTLASGKTRPGPGQSSKSTIAWWPALEFQIIMHPLDPWINVVSTMVATYNFAASTFSIQIHDLYAVWFWTLLAGTCLCCRDRVSKGPNDNQESRDASPTSNLDRLGNNWSIPTTSQLHQIQRRQIDEKQKAPKWTGWMEAWWMSFSFWLSIYYSWFLWDYWWIRWPCSVEYSGAEQLSGIIQL